jgi:putative GTP pyrophosphokinase
MPDEANASNDWDAEFSRVRGRLVDFTNAMNRLISQLLTAAKIDAAPLEARTKTASSFAEKRTRKRGKYNNPLIQMTDLVGLRIILYYPGDVAAVGDLIEREFAIDWENSYRDDPSNEPDRFGYRSDHYIVRLKEPRLTLSEWSPYRDDCAEIQVRTVMQHAWAAVDHRIRYKGADLPPDLQRRLYRLSALLEVADGQFASLQDAAAEATSAYQASVEAGELDVALDALSLRAYVDQPSVGAAWTERAIAAGYIPHDADDAPEAVRASRLEELLGELQAAGVTKLARYQQLMESAERWGDQALATIAETAAQVKRPAAIPEYVLLAMAQAVAKSDESLVRVNWADWMADAIKAAYSVPDFRIRPED